MSTRILSVLTLFVLLAVMIAAGIQPQSAPAGTNGQQLSIGTCTEMAPRTFFYYVVVTGKNQFGQTVMWKSDWKGGYRPGCKFDTTNWWWVGTVKVTVKSSAGYLSSGPWTKSVTVPKTQMGDWYWVSVP